MKTELWCCQVCGIILEDTSGKKPKKCTSCGSTEILDGIQILPITKSYKMKGTP